MTETEAEALAIERFASKFKDKYIPALIRFKSKLFNDQAPIDWIMQGRIDDVAVIYEDLFPDRNVATPLPKELYIRLKQSYLDKGYRRVPPRIIIEVHRIMEKMGEDFEESAITHLFA